MTRHILAVFVCVSMILYVSAQDHEAIRKEIKKIIRYETDIKFKDTPGFIIGMLDHDSSYILPFGQRAFDDENPILASDIFEIGGVTKVFTALLVESLKNKFHLDLHHSINTYLPFSNPEFDSCSVIKLLTHTSGLPKNPPGWGLKEQDSQDPYAQYTQQDLEQFYKGYKFKSNPANNYLFSHLNFTILTWMLEHTTGIGYNELLKNYLPENIRISTESKPTIIGYRNNLKAARPWTIHSAFSGSVGGRANLHQLMSFCQYFLTPGESAYRNILPLKDIVVRKEKGKVALGLQVVPVSKNKYIYFHTGRTEGHYVFMAFLPETRTGVVIMANAARGTDVLGLSILRMMNKNWKR